MLTAIDGQISGGGGLDKLRMKIIDNSTSAVVYDNQLGASDNGDPTTVIGGGSIAIHANGGALPAALSPAHPEAFEYALAQNRPNPFHADTEIRFTLREQSSVSLAVYDLSGREVRQLVQEEMVAGPHATAWSGRDRGGNVVQKGVYFLRMTATAASDGSHFSVTRRIVVL
jgi:hypothetical protein